MNYEQALELLRGEVDLTEFTRHQCAQAIEAEIARLRGINERNKDNYVKMRDELAKERRDTGIYKNRYETLTAKVKQLELKLMALGGSGRSAFNDLFGF